MTYQEIKERLTKCELTLEKIKDGTYKPENVKQATEKLQLLRESYLKLLNEAQEKTYLVTPKSGKTAALSLGDEEVDALKDADDIDKIKSSDGQEVKEMKPGDPEDLERKRMERLSPKDRETIAKIYALMQNANKMEGEEADNEDLPAIDRMYNSDAWVKAQQDAQEGTEVDTDGGDLDIGHQDDEPDMLKQYAYDIAHYAAKLYKQLDKYDKMDGEVDFPNWWQSKVILAKDYIAKAQHYLEFEEKQPAIDALALEENVEEASANKIKKEYDELVGKMKQLAQHYKTAEGEKKEKIVSALKQHTARKRELEAALDKAVSGIGAGQELDTNVSEGRESNLDLDEISDYARRRAAERDYQPTKKDKPATPFKEPKNDYFARRKKVADVDEALPTGFGTGQGRSKTISRGREARPDLAQARKDAVKPKKKYVMKNGVPHKYDADGNLVPLKKINEYRGSGDDIKAIIRDKAADSGFSEQEEAMEVMEFIGQEYEIDFEFGAGQELDTTVSEEYKAAYDSLIEAIKELNTDGDEIGAAQDAMEFIGQHYGIDFEFGAGPSRQI